MATPAVSTSTVTITAAVPSTGSISALMSPPPVAPIDPRVATLFNYSTRGDASKVSNLLIDHLYSSSVRGRAVVLAAASGHLEVVSSILNKGPITRDYCDTAIAEAWEGEHAEVKAFLTDYRHNLA